MAAKPRNTQLLLLVGAAVVLATWHVFRWGFVVDDAFIAFRHLDNFVHGRGLVYNPGERVEGYSSILWLLLLAGPVALGAPPDVCALLLGYAIGLGTLAALYSVARGFMGLRPVFAAVSLVVLAAQAPWAFWVAGGLEVPLVALLVLLLLAACGRVSRSEGGALPALLLAALLALARPEGILALPIVLVLLARHPPADRRAAILGLVLYAVLVGGHFAFRLAYYGHPFANPYYAKVSVNLASARRGVAYVMSYLVEEGFFYVAPVVFFARSVRERPRTVTAAVGVLALEAAFIVYVGGDPLYKHRFFAHVAPVTSLLVAAALQRLGDLHRGVGWAAAVFVPAALLASGFAYPIDAIRVMEARWEATGAALRQASAPSLVLASTVAGKIAYRADRTTIDMLGLCDPVIARTPVVDMGTGYAGHERAAPGYVLGRHPDVIFLSALDDAPAGKLGDRAWLEEAMRRSVFYRYAVLFDFPELIANYRPALLRLGPDIRPVPLFVRVGAPITEQALVRLDWSKAPPPSATTGK